MTTAINVSKPLKIDEITKETLIQIEEQKQKIKDMDEKVFLKYVIEEIDAILKDGGIVKAFEKDSKVLFAITDNNHIILTYPAIAIVNALKELDNESQKIFIDELKKNGILKRVRQISGRNVYDEKGYLCEIKINGNQIVGSKFIVINNNTKGVYKRHSKRANLRNIKRVVGI